MSKNSNTLEEQNKLDLRQFKDTPAVKKLAKSKSNEKMIETRGRKTKYATDDERKEAKRKQQKEYRMRKRAELAELKKIVAGKE